MDRNTNRETNRWMDGQTDRPNNGQMDQRKDGPTKLNKIENKLNILKHKAAICHRVWNTY